jgi:hypothetical protein
MLGRLNTLYLSALLTYVYTQPNFNIISFTAVASKHYLSLKSISAQIYPIFLCAVCVVMFLTVFRRTRPLNVALSVWYCL